MIYNAFQGKKLSALGFGGMRLPTLGKNALIDEEKTREMVDYAIKNGINYFDTAYGYHGGNSEKVLGKILSSYPRESFYLADKFPGYDVNYILADKVEEIFQEQLDRCGVEYFDFYLFHNVNETNIDAYLDPKYRIYEYLLEQKKKGRIRHLGFSVHGNLTTTRRFLEAYGKDMEFGQIQLNYIDYHLQNAVAKIKLLREDGIPVWVMEPLRGGKLCALSEEHTERLSDLRPEENTVSWAFRFLQSIPDVTVTLSGMSNLQQLSDNIGYFSENKPLNEEENATLFQIAREMMEKSTLPCTGCAYCTASCPQNIDIPWMMELYNEHSYSGGGWLAPTALGTVPENRRPQACIGCGACVALCPQNIDIPKMMADFTEKLEKK